MFDNIVVTAIGKIFTVSSPRGRCQKIHNRKSYALSFCTSGQITYTHNGKKIVSDKNHAIILPQGQTYAISGDRTGSFPVINFKCMHRLCDTIVSIPLQNADAYLRDYENMKSLSLFDGNKAEIMSIFYHMLHRLSAQNLTDSIIMPAVKHIEEFYRDPSLSVSELARLCCISEVYLRRKFSEYYGMSPKQFILDIRLNRAKQLLSESTLKIGEIATQCGFSNQYHFCRIFKEKLGMAPTEYARQNKIYKI